MDRYTTGRAAKVIGVSDSTIRGWAKLFAAFLSPDANPPKGQNRVFVASDLAVFELVKGWRAADPLLTDDDLAARLAQVPAADLRGGPSVDSGQASAAGASSAPASSGDGAAVEDGGADLPAVLPAAGDPGALLAALVDRLGAVDQRLAAVEAQGTAQRSAAMWIVVGLLIGGLLGILIGAVIMGAR